MDKCVIFYSGVFFYKKIIKKSRHLKKTVQSALVQIKEKNYDAELLARGIPKEKIRHYGFAFEGKKCVDRIVRRY